MSGKTRLTIARPQAAVVPARSPVTAPPDAARVTHAAADTLANRQAELGRSPAVQRLVGLHRAVNAGSAAAQLAPDNRAVRGGLPQALRSGIEQLSGVAMDNVRVHRNSPAPARIGAHAYAQGRDIHLAPGQETHLPHEAWHLVQQAQGRVRPTLQAKGAAINDDAGLEAEADRMGSRAAAMPVTGADTPAGPSAGGHAARQLQRVGPGNANAPLQRQGIKAGKLNVVGESHPESNPRRDSEKQFVATKGFGPNAYFKENEYKYKITQINTVLGASSFLGLVGFGETTTEHFGDPAILRVEKRIGDTKEKLLPIAAVFRAGKVPPSFANLGDIVIAWNGFTKYGIAEELKQIQLTMGELLKVSGEEKHATSLIQLYGLVDKSRQYYATRDPVLVVPADVVKFETLWQQIEFEFTKAIKGGKPLAPVDKVDKERSTAMDKAATHSAVTPAVWKIGQDHVKDIKADKGYNAAALRYNLVTRGEFNAEFLPWERAGNEKKYARQIAYGHELADMYGWSAQTVYEMAIKGEFDENVQVREQNMHERKKKGGPPSYIG